MYAPWFAEGLLVLMLLLVPPSRWGRDEARAGRDPANLRRGDVPDRHRVSLWPHTAGASATARGGSGGGGSVAGLLVYGFRRLSRPGAPVETTPNEYWTLGGITGTNDPALFVQKRIG